MYNPVQERKAYTKQFQEAAAQRKASNDTQFFWDLVNRHVNGMVPRRPPNRAHEERALFSKSNEQQEAPVGGGIDDNIPVQRSGSRSEDVGTLESFQELQHQVPPYVMRCVELMKFERPTPIQKHAIPLGLAGLDLMCCAQTVSTPLPLLFQYVS
ncbi:hypothetical protein EON64_17060 [archaeon]|nr:MAG: hypothetical protein EON64_17060 [archaeon]